MGLLETTLIALGLAMDCFAVSVASGICFPAMGPRIVFRMALFFGGFQLAMAVIGWTAGSLLLPWIESFDHWLAFALLSAVGGRMIYESRKDGTNCSYDPSRFPVLIALSVATSIDALAVGVGISVLGEPIPVAASVIGSASFIMTVAGVLLGKRFGHIFEKKFEIAGGLILIGIGLKILIEHLT